MKRYKSVFERAVEASEKVANITLQAQYQKNMFKCFSKKACITEL